MPHKKQVNEMIKAELADERLRLKMMHNMIGSGSWSMTYDEKGERQSVIWSDEVRAALGCTREEYPDAFEPWVERLHPDEREEQLKKVFDFFRNAKPGDVYDAEYRMRTNDRGYRWFRVVGDVIRWPNGMPHQFFGGCIDINARKEYDLLLQEKVKTLEERIQYQETVALEKEKNELMANNTITSGMWSVMLKEAAVESVYWSRELRQMLGYLTEEEFPNTLDAMVEQIHPLDREKMMSAFEAACSDFFGNENFEVEARIMRSNGNYRWYKATGTVKRSRNGVQGNFIGTLTDINDQKNKEQILFQQQRDNRIISVLAMDYSAVYYIDLLTEDIFPYSMGSSVETPIGTVFSNGFKYSDAFRLYIKRTAAPEDLQRVVGAGTIKNIHDKLTGNISFSVSYNDKNGEPCEMKFVKANNGKMPTAAVLAFSKQATRASLKQQEAFLKLKSEQEDEAKKEFLHNMAGDSCRLLDELLLLLYEAKSKTNEPARMAGYLKRFILKTKQVRQLSEDVLEMSMVESGNIDFFETRTNLLDYAESVITEMQDAATEKGLDLKLEIRDIVSPFVSLDKANVETILKQIISNGIKFTPSVGRVSCIVEQEKLTDSDKVRCRFIIEDNGIGMSEEFQSQIYELFAREKTDAGFKAEGTGLGMPIVKRLLSLLGGKINIKSEKNYGTTVTVELDCRAMKN